MSARLILFCAVALGISPVPATLAHGAPATDERRFVNHKGCNLPLFGSAESPAIVTEPPVYPTQFRQSHTEGEAVVIAFVAEDGQVTDVEIKQSKPAPDFGIAAQKCMRQWIYPVRQKDGHPIAYAVEQPIHFSIRKQKKEPHP